MNKQMCKNKDSTVIVLLPKELEKPYFFGGMFLSVCFGSFFKQELQKLQ